MSLILEQLKANTRQDYNPERWLGKDKAGLAWIEAGVVVTVRTGQIYCLQTQAGVYHPAEKDGGKKMEADSLVVHYEDGNGVLQVKPIPPSSRFPQPNVFIEDDKKLSERGFLLVAIL